MLSKGKINMILGLCLTSIVSVGFSSWVIGESFNSAEVTGNIEVDNIINSSEYVYLDTTKGDLDEQGNHTGITTLKYNTNGYLDEQNINTEHGIIEAYFYININKCKEIFDYLNNPSLEIILTLKYANNNGALFDIFAEKTLDNGSSKLSDYTLDVTNGISAEFGIATKLKKQHILPIYFKDILKTTNNEVGFKIQYKFFSTIGEYFTQNIYSCLHDNAVEFALNIAISCKQ